jgi:sirohydrochlorin cobaltochelatase
LKQAIVLFAHGSRDAGWARPFERIAATLAKKIPGCVVRIAYLESMRPSLEEVLRQLAGEEVRRVRLVPVFLGQGSHLKEDLPKLAAAARSGLPQLELSLEPPIGEQPEVIEAIARAIAAKNP